MANISDTDLVVKGGLTVQGTTASLPASSIGNTEFAANDPLARAKLAQDTLQKYVVPLTDFRVWDAFHTSLPGTSAADDLALIGGTFGTDSPSLQTYDVKAAGAVTLYARVTVRLPIEYDDGQTVNLRVRCGMLTTVADTTATIDVEAYESNKEAGIGADLIATAATDCNNLTLADKDFVVTASGLVSGDWLDVRLAMAINDAATGTVVQGVIGGVELLCDVRG